MSQDHKNSELENKLLLMLLCVAQFMLILDVAVVAVAVPSIQSNLSVPAAEIQWVSTAYSLTFGGFMVAFGRAADLFGPKKTLLLGVVVFIVASALCGFASSGELLFVSRALQGLGAALVSPAALALVTINFGEGGQRNKALGLWGAVSSGGAVVGQLLGGVLVDVAGWRSIFWINVPFGAAVVIGVTRLVRRDSQHAIDRVDIFGSILLTSGVVCFVAGVSQAAEHGFSSAVAFFGILGIVLLSFLIIHESRVPNPVLRLSMFKNPHVLYGNIICMLTAGGATVSVFLGTLYMQQVLELSPLMAGIGFVPITLVILVTSARMGALTARFGVRLLLLWSAICFAVGALLMSFVPTHGSYWLNVFPGLMVGGVGAALSFAPSMIVSTTGVSDDEQGFASGLIGTSQQVGGALFLAFLTGVTAAVTGDRGTAAAMTDGFRAGFLWSLIIPALMLICLLILPASAIVSDFRDADGSQR